MTFIAFLRNNFFEKIPEYFQHGFFGAVFGCFVGIRWGRFTSLALPPKLIAYCIAKVIERESADCYLAPSHISLYYESLGLRKDLRRAKITHFDLF